MRKAGWYPVRVPSKDEEMAELRAQLAESRRKLGAKNEKIRELRARPGRPCSSSSATRRTNTGSSSPGQAGGRGRPRIYGGHDSVDPYPIVGPDKANVFVNLEESAG